MISMFASSQTSARMKIAGKRPKDTAKPQLITTSGAPQTTTKSQANSYTTEKLRAILGEDSIMDDPETTTLTRTTAEGLYKREQGDEVTKLFNKAAEETSELRKFKSKTNKIRETMYDFTPSALTNLRNEANQHFDTARGRIDEERYSV